MVNGKNGNLSTSIHRYYAFSSSSFLGRDELLTLWLPSVIDSAPRLHIDQLFIRQRRRHFRGRIAGRRVQRRITIIWRDRVRKGKHQISMLFAENVTPNQRLRDEVSVSRALVYIKRQVVKSTKIGLLNTQSIGNQSTRVRVYISSDESTFFAVVETWHDSGLVSESRRVSTERPLLHWEGAPFICQECCQY